MTPTIYTTILSVIIYGKTMSIAGAIATILAYIILLTVSVLFTVGAVKILGTLFLEYIRDWRRGRVL